MQTTLVVGDTMKTALDQWAFYKMYDNQKKD